MISNATITEGTGACPQCGRPLPAGRLAGLCPACLLAQGLDSEPGEPAREGGAHRVHPPTLDRIRALFPHLEIHSLLGAGGMGAVFKARQPALDRWVALKVLPRSSEEGTAAGAAPARAPSPERFNREARALARLSHPNVVGVFEFGQVEGWHYFVMEYVDGANLRQLLRTGRLSPREALQIVPQICDALQYAHDAGVVHRDIKPENVLVDRQGRVKIADFGLAKLVDSPAEAARLTVEGQVMGTPHYMAPEQLERPLAVDHRADIYSLGVVLYEMLTGDLPLGHFQPPSRKVQVDVRLDEVVLKALENDPARRYQHASEVKTGVEHAQVPQADAGQAMRDAANDWRVRWFGHSPEAAAIWRNLTRDERWMDAGLQAGIVGLSLTPLLGLWILASNVGPAPAFVWLLVLAVFVGLQSALLWAGMRVCRLFLASTRWARQHGVRAESLRLYATPRWLGGKGGNTTWWLHLAAGLVLGMVAVTVFLNAQPGSRTRPPWPAPQANLSRVGGERPPVATVRADSLPAVGRVGSSGRVELLGVSASGSNGWWAPDGSALPTARWIAGTGLSASPDDAVRRVVFRWSDLPQGADGHFAEVPDGRVLASGLDVQGDANPQGLGWVAVAARPGTERGALRLGFAVDPWMVLARHDPAGGATRLETDASTRGIWVEVHRVTDRPEGTQMMLLIRGGDPAWRWSMFTLKSDGAEVSATQEDHTSLGDGFLVTAGFGSVPLSEVREIQVRARPITWVEFRDIAWNPGARTVASPELDDAPRLRFLAWQPAAGQPDPASAWTPDGRTLDREEDREMLRRMIPTRVDVSATEAGRQNPRFLHLWFEHPAFESDTEVEVRLADEHGAPLKTAASGSTASRDGQILRRGRTESWITMTISPGEQDHLPTIIGVTLEYVVGPLERTSWVPSSFEGAMSLDAGGMVNGVGQNAPGKAFLALTQILDPQQPRILGARARRLDGSELSPIDRMRSGPSDGSTRVARFGFDAPLADLQGFLAGSRPVRRAHWPKVVLRPPPPLLQTARDEAR